MTPHASSRLASFMGGARVGSATSTEEAVNKLNAYIVSASPRHDLSTESWRAVWAARFGVDASKPDGLAWANKDGVKILLDDIDACAPGYAGGCDKAVSAVFDGMNISLGLAGDNGWMTFTQLMQWLDRYPVNADDTAEDRAKAEAPAPKPEGRFFERRAKPPTPEGFMVSPAIVPAKPKEPSLTTNEKAALGVVPVGFGGLSALRWGWVGLVVGGAAGLVTTGAIIAWRRWWMRPKTTGHVGGS